MTYRRIFSILLAIISASCDFKKEVKTVILEDCWNINHISESNVSGKAFVLRSMEGLSLYSLGCSDANGKNNFTFSDKASSSITKFLRGRPQNNIESVLIFRFSGNVERVKNKNVLNITDVRELRFGASPPWLMSIRKR
jgi:hypothetical protein